MEYNFVGGEAEVAITLQNGKTIEAIIQQPTALRELQHIKEGFVEVIDNGKGSEEQINHGPEADVRLYDELALQIKPIRLSGEPKGVGVDFRPCDEQVNAATPIQWKSQFVTALRRAETEVVEPDEDEVVLGEQVLTVRVYIPSKADPIYTIDFDVPAPKEGELEKLEKSITEFIPKYKNSNRNNSGKFVLHIERAVKAFDEKFKEDGADIRGAVVGDRDFATARATSPVAVMAFLEAIRPSLKLRVLDTALRHYTGRIRD